MKSASTAAAAGAALAILACRGATDPHGPGVRWGADPYVATLSADSLSYTMATPQITIDPGPGGWEGAQSFIVTFSPAGSCAATPLAFPQATTGRVNVGSQSSVTFGVGAVLCQDASGHYHRGTFSGKAQVIIETSNGAIDAVLHVKVQ